MRAAGSISAVCMLIMGCGDVHSLRNLPGTVADLRTRPPEPTSATSSPVQHEARHPQPVGEDHFTFAGGPLVGGGTLIERGGSGGVFSAGGEFSMLYSYTPTRHDEGIAGPTPEHAFGGHMGFTYTTSTRGSTALYTELAARVFYTVGIGAGWQVDPIDKLHGPQLTVNLGPLYVRVGHQFGNGTSIVVGGVLKGQVTYSISR